MLMCIYGNIPNLDYLKELFVQKMSVNSSANEKTINEETIKLYATTWCGDCRMAKRWFDSHGIPYEYINIEEDDKAGVCGACESGYAKRANDCFPRWLHSG